MRNKVKHHPLLQLMSLLIIGLFFSPTFASLPLVDSQGTTLPSLAPMLKRTTPAVVNIATSDWTPAVDIKETESEFLIRADIPGVNPDDIDVHMENGMLTIKGERKSETKDEREGYKRIERHRGTFYRRFSLPDTANADKISAKSNHGVLEITIPKQEKAQARKIQVN